MTSEITGLERFDDVGLWESIMDQPYSREDIGRMEAKELGLEYIPDKGDVNSFIYEPSPFPSKQYNETFQDNLRKKLQSRFDIVKPEQQDYDSGLIEKKEAEVNLIEGAIATFNAYITGQIIDDIDIANDMGFADKKAQMVTLEDGTQDIYDWTTDPAMQVIINMGQGQLFVDEQVVNQQHAFYLKEKIMRNTEYYDKMARGHWISMLAGGLIDPVNFFGFGWAARGMYGIKTLNSTLGRPISKTIGIKGTTLIGRGVGGGSGVAATVALLEPLRWELDPLAGPAQSPGVIAGAFIFGSAFHGAVVPAFRTASGKGWFGPKFKKKHIDSQGGEEQLFAKYLEDEHLYYGDDGYYQSFEYKVGDDLMGIVVNEEGYTGRWLTKDGGILNTKINKRIYESVHPNDKGDVYIPVQVVEKQSGGTQTRIVIKYDDLNLSEWWKTGEWKTQVPEQIHRYINNIKDYKDFSIKREIYREIIYPYSEFKGSPKEHLNFVNQKTSEDLLINSREDIRTDYGDIRFLSEFTEFYNKFTDGEMGSRSFSGDKILQNYIGRTIYSILGDNAVPSRAKFTALKNSIHNAKMTVHLFKFLDFQDGLRTDFNNYSLGVVGRTKKYRREMFTRRDPVKNKIHRDEFFARLEDKYKRAILGEYVPRNEKLFENEFEELIVKLVTTEDPGMTNIVDVNIRNAIQRTRDFLKMYETDLKDLKMLHSKDNLIAMQNMYNNYIKELTDILKQDSDSLTPLLTKDQRRAMKSERNIAIKERNSYGLDKNLDEVPEFKDQETQFEFPENYYPVRYLSDRIVDHPQTFRMNVLYPYFIAERLGIDTAKKYPKEFAMDIRVKLNNMKKKEKEAVINDTIKSVNQVTLNIVDRHSKYGEIDGGFNGFDPELLSKDNKNNLSPLIQKVLKIPRKAMIDVKSFSNPNETVSFISRNLKNDLAIYSDKIATAIEMTNRHGDKNGRTTLYAMKLKMLKKIRTRKDVTEFNRVASTFENAVNKQYNVFSPASPSNYLTRFGNISRDIVAPAKLGGVLLTSQADWSGLVLNHGLKETFEKAGIFRQMKNMLTEQELKDFERNEAFMIPLMEYMANLSPLQRYAAYDTLPLGSKSNLNQNIAADIANTLEGGLGKVEHSLRDFNTFFYQSIFLPQYTGFVKKFAGNISQHRFIEELIKAVDGTISPAELRRLKNYGFAEKDIQIFKRIRDAKLLGDYPLEYKGKKVVAYIPDVEKWNAKGIKGVSSFSLLFRSAVKADSERTILTPNAADNMNLAHGGIGIYSERGMSIFGHPQFKKALTAGTTGLGYAIDGVTGGAVGLGLGLGTSITKGQNQVMIGNVSLKLLFMFQGWTRRAMRVRGTNAVSGEEKNYWGGVIASTTIGMFMNYLKDPSGQNALWDNEEYHELVWRGMTSSGAFHVNADILNMADRATQYQYGYRGIMGLKPPYGPSTPMDWTRDLGAIPNIANEGYDVFRYGSDKKQSEYLRKLYPYNNVPFLGNAFYRTPDERGGSPLGYLTKPITDFIVED